MGFWHTYLGLYGGGGTPRASAATPCFIQGAAPQSNNHVLFLSGNGFIASGTPLFISPLNAQNGVVQLFTSGQSIASINASVPLLINAEDFASINSPLFIVADLSSSLTSPLVLYGLDNVTDAIPLYLSTIDLIAAKIVYKLVCHINRKQLSQLLIRKQQTSQLLIDQRNLNEVEL